jgi:DNA-binding IclR family transcriptional regulator
MRSVEALISLKLSATLPRMPLLRRQRDRRFAAEDLVRTLRASPTVVSTFLKQLRSAGLVDCDPNGDWRFAPASAELDALAARLEQVYAERPFAVIAAILDTPNDRLRSFADAFRFPKKED